MNFPENLRYTKDHEWVKIEGDEAGGKSQLLHTLNGSSLALPRILACLLENNQTENGILLPPALLSYFGSEMI